MACQRRIRGCFIPPMCSHGISPIGAMLMTPLATLTAADPAAEFRADIAGKILDLFTSQCDAVQGSALAVIDGILALLVTVVQHNRGSELTPEFLSGSRPYDPGGELPPRGSCWDKRSTRSDWEVPGATYSLSVKQQNSK